jgi:hypothetical protein
LGIPGNGKREGKKWTYRKGWWDQRGTSLYDHRITRCSESRR